MLELEIKPKNVKEAIEAGWMTAKEIYEAAGVCRDTFNEFLSVVRKAASEKPNSSCRIDPTTEKCITGAHNVKYYHPKVMKAFQLYLMRNQTNQGKSSQVVKETAKQSLEFGLTAKVVIGSGDVEAANEFAKLIVQATQNQKDLLEQQQQNQKLKLENQTMRTTLQYDKVKGWYRWSDLKRDWKPYSDRLKKGNYETIFYEAGLEYGKDYEEITFNGYEFPTCMVSPTAVPILMNYLNISIN
jgi:hypothetical protein